MTENQNSNRKTFPPKRETERWQSGILGHDFLPRYIRRDLRPFRLVDFFSRCSFTGFHSKTGGEEEEERRRKGKLEEAGQTKRGQRDEQEGARACLSTLLRLSRHAHSNSCESHERASHACSVHGLDQPAYFQSPRDCIRFESKVAGPGSWQPRTAGGEEEGHEPTNQRAACKRDEAETSNTGRLRKDSLSMSAGKFKC